MEINHIVSDDEDIPSDDKKSIEFPTGHVGLCISQRAHDKLWPEVSEWLSKRSSNH